MKTTNFYCVLLFVVMSMNVSAQVLPPQLMLYPLNGSSADHMASIEVPASIDLLGIAKAGFNGRGARPEPPVVAGPAVEGKKGKLNALELYCAQDVLSWMNTSGATTEACAALVRMPDGKPSYNALVARANARLSGSDKRNFAGTGLGEGKAAQIALQQLGDKVFALVVQPIESKVDTEESKGVKVEYDFVLLQLEVTSSGSAADFAASKPNVKLIYSATVFGSGTNAKIGEGDAASGSLAGIAGAAAQKVAAKVQKTEAELRAEAHKKASQSMFLLLSRKVEAFRPSASVEALAGGKVRVELGKKEGLKADDRYAVFETILLDDGSVKFDRTAVLRSMRPADNTSSRADSIVLSKFYRTGGRKPQAGMQVQAMPDIGLSASLGYGTNAWLRLAYRTKLIPGLKVFAELNPMRGNLKARPEFFQQLIQTDPYLGDWVDYTTTEGDVSVIAFSVTGGISLEKHIMTFLSVEPFLGAGYSEVSTSGNLVELGDGIYNLGVQFNETTGYIYDSFHAIGGLRVPIHLSHNIHIEPSVGWAMGFLGGMNSNAVIELTDDFGGVTPIYEGINLLTGELDPYGIDLTQYDLDDVFTGDLTVLQDLVWDVMLRIEF